jgi:protein-tyrosine phosphatase
MIDTHNHLLPGIDDGSGDIEETLGMCRIALEDGVKTVVATPHSLDGRFVNNPEKIKVMVERLQATLFKRSMDLRILPGMEVRLSAELIDHISEGRVLPLNDRKYILLEFQHSQVPAGFQNLARSLCESGYGLIIAHAERNLIIQRNPEYLFKLLRLFKPWDILVQITSGAITGEIGFWASRTAKLLLKNHLVHIIASDAHSSVQRAPRLMEAVEDASKMVGSEQALMMVEDIPRVVIHGGDHPELWPPANPRRWWRLL